MNCREVSQLIELFVLAELDYPQYAAVQAHLDVCPVCRRYESEYRSVIAKVRQSTSGEFPSLDFTRRLKGAVDAEIRKASRSRLVVQLAASGMIAACIVFGLTAWRLIAGSSAHDRTSAVKQFTRGSERTGRGVYDPEAISPNRQFTGPESTSTEFILSGTNVYLIDDSTPGKIAAADAETGRQKWRSQVDRCRYIAADDYRVYCVAESGPAKFDLVAVNSRNGQTLWRYHQECFNLSQHLNRPTILPEGRICWVLDATVHVLAAPNGRVLWTETIGEDNLLSPAVADRHSLYVAGTEGVYCLDIESGTRTWNLPYSIQMDKRTKPIAALSETHFYACLGILSGRDILLGIERARRRVVWAKTISDVSYLHATRDKVYVRNGGVQALDSRNGRLIWHHTSRGEGPLICSNGLVYLVDSDRRGRLIALNELTGHRVWGLAGMHSCCAFVKIGGSGYLRTANGAIHKIIIKG